MKIALDELDKNIMHHICKGIYSYRDLGRICHVERSTIYRRINRLENMHVISKKIMAIPDFTKLDLSALCIGMDVMQEDVDKAVDLLKEQPQVKFLWKTYGTHNVITVMICNKGEEGQSIFNLRKTLGKLKIQKFDISVGFSWEKVDFTPY
jgi:DNA-binding Lrp family transcriptional regulator